MALGAAVVEQRFENPRELLGDRLKGVYRLLAEHGDRLFPQDYFADLYKDSARGRPTVPARVLATVMVLQAQEGLSDQEAVDHLECDLRWQAAAGVDAGYVAFHSTVLVGQRNRLRGSQRPKRFLEDTRVVARAAGVLRDRVRVLDSTPIYDAVSTQDTVTQLRSAIRKLLRALEGSELAGRVRAVLARDDDYASAGKPPCDWDDRQAREALVDALVRDALAALEVVDGVDLTAAAREAAELLALVAGQDVERGDDGVFRIARKVARDRVISTVDPDARHGHKSVNRRFDGYKAHLSVDPDSELIDDVVVTPANTHDADPVNDLLAGHADSEDKPTVIGDSAYAGADTLDDLQQAGFDVNTKVPPAGRRDGRFGKDDFIIDLDANTVACPAGHVATPMGRAARSSPSTASLARCAPNAPHRRQGAPSRSTRKRRSCKPRRPPRRTRNASTNTGRLGRKSNARSLISCVPHGADAEPAAEDDNASPPTPSLAPPRSTGHGSPRSASPSPTAAGRPAPTELPTGEPNVGS
jgi:hypothetical protein